ncbi:forkhead box protein H1 [Nerophis lumbriciformis]|uniref:forkhead box protein H1 n=1 Tax=Nerophis lumbriciformis TaxID=546530 RepID=UPI002ADF1857|nr:forkhead box protein H1-like [Nerophis lumbriciformis]XP_061787107.1 forkhead box protein H1-like [Nerophis lumbriciformis]XP_061787108.1 forkhead box protein H1-like [Nerophis lumbriciformis]
MQTTRDKSPGDVFQRSTTNLARIAVILQAAPDKMLTFAQLMDRLAPLLPGDRKSVDNNIRVCLSINNCFVKIPMDPNSVDSRRNFWKLDLGQISSKMVRRHFKNLLDFFPELAPGGGNAENVPQPPGKRPRDSVQIRCEVKFSSPFSIESLLKRDSPAPARPQRRDPEERSFTGSPAGGSTRDNWRTPVQPVFLAYHRPGGGPYSHHPYAAFAHDARRLRL